MLAFPLVCGVRMLEEDRVAEGANGVVVLPRPGLARGVRAAGRQHPLQEQVVAALSGQPVAHRADVDEDFLEERVTPLIGGSA